VPARPQRQWQDHTFQDAAGPSANQGGGGTGLAGRRGPVVAVAGGDRPADRLCAADPHGLLPLQRGGGRADGPQAYIGPFSSPGSHDRVAAAAAMAAMGINHLASRSYTEVSGGERQLALVARALAQAAPVLVMDEPTSSLDFGNQVRVLERIRALKLEGWAIVLSTHDPAQAHALADRVALLDRGRIVALGPPDEVAKADSLGELYGVRVAVERLSAADAVAVVPLY
jgi:hypothetical protein